MDVFRVPRGGELGGRVLPRAGRRVFGVQAAGRALPRLHRDPKGQRLPVVAHILFGPYGSPIEVQIRTREIYLVAERGGRALSP